jgi:hypothetical protein
VQARIVRPVHDKKIFAHVAIDNVKDMVFAPPAEVAPFTAQFATMLGYPFEFLRRSLNVGS